MTSTAIYAQLVRLSVPSPGALPDGSSPTPLTIPLSCHFQATFPLLWCSLSFHILTPPLLARIPVLEIVSTPIFLKFNVYWGITGLWHYLSFMCITLCFYFCIHYRVFITKNLVFICHHTADPLYPFCPLPPHPFPSGNHYSVLCIYVFVFVWFVHLFGSFVCFLTFLIRVKSYSICLSPSDLLHPGVIPSRSIHVVTDGKVSSLFYGCLLHF